MKRLTLALALIVLLSGCQIMAYEPEIVSIGNGNYTMAGESYWTDNAGLLRIEMIKHANAYCQKQGREAVILDSYVKDGVTVGYYGTNATSTVNFRCE